jgi:hypothetical protein
MSKKSRKKQEEINPLRNALRSFLMVLVVIFVYAVAVESTQIDLELATRPARQDTFIRVLAHDGFARLLPLIRKRRPLPALAAPPKLPMSGCWKRF